MNRPPTPETLPLVSIALTTYNGARYLAAQMESLLAQSYPQIEIVVSDDGSTDGTRELLAAYARQHPRIRVLEVNGNLGFNRNFARCFAACRGELISPCDQDDIWHPEKTWRLVQALGDATLVYANSRYIDSEGRPLQRQLSDEVRMVGGSDPRAFLFGNCVSGHAMLFHRSLVAAAGEFPPAVYFDWWLAFVAANVGRVAYLDEVLVDYRRHAQAVTFKPRGQDSAGRRLKALQIQTGRFEAMAGFAGPQQGFIRELRAHWLAWYAGWLGWGLFRFVWQHALILFQTSPKHRPAWHRASRFLIGHRLKRALLPRGYLPLEEVSDLKRTAR